MSRAGIQYSNTGCKGFENFTVVYKICVNKQHTVYIWILYTGIKFRVFRTRNNKTLHFHFITEHTQLNTCKNNEYCTVYSVHLWLTIFLRRLLDLEKLNTYKIKYFLRRDMLLHYCSSKIQSKNHWDDTWKFVVVNPICIAVTSTMYPVQNTPGYLINLS